MSKAESVKRRDGYQCRLCHSVKSLQAHHLFGQKRFPELKEDQRNLITLCHKCHSKFHRFCPNGVNTGHDFIRFLDQLFQEKGMTQAYGLMKTLKGTIFELDRKIKSSESELNVAKCEWEEVEQREGRGQSVDDVQGNQQLSGLIESNEINHKIKPLSQMDLRLLEPQFQVKLMIQDANQQMLYQYQELFCFSQLQELQKYMNRFMASQVS